MGSKKLQVWLPLVFALVMTFGMFIGYRLKESTSGAVAFLKNTNRTSLQEVLELIRSKYVDPVKADSLTENVIDDLLSKLDPHSVYIPAKELAEANEDMQGNFQGIGIEFQLIADTVNVTNVVAGGPSEKAGIMVGDKFLAVNDTARLAGIKTTADNIRKNLRGPEGSSVKVTLLRDNSKKNIMITRGIIPLPAVDVAYLLNENTGFIRINKFSETVYSEFMVNLEKLQKKGMKQLVLDLRGNGGGLVNEATKIADEFLSDDKLITYTQGDKVGRQEYRCKKDGLFETGKLAVLVDETTASASEILVGALQDWDRATIIGRRTFGKGLVQQPFQLSDGSGLRLTVARYYTPVGRNIQKPYNKGKEQYEEELIQRFHNGEVVIGDTAKPQGKAYKTPGGRLVYGGGGITPDVFVPYDTTTQPKQILELYMKGTLSEFIYKSYIRNRNFFNTLKSPEELAQQYHPSEKEWNELKQFAEQDSISLDKVPAKAKAEMLTRLQPLMARQMWRTEGYYEISNKTDPMLAKALAALK
ncbi:MAG: carboxy-terminal processing protease [Chitinophagaceae bacterium]|nr:carboxy-terminal processing protease [Chitinophagaceae bacterium]